MAISALFILVTALQAAAGVSSDSKCPTNGILKASIPGYGTIKTMNDVHTCLLNCRDSIEHLDLRAYLSGCSEWPDRWNLPFPLAGGNGSSKEQRQGDSSSSSHYYPTLKSLKLEEYNFDQSDWADVQPSNRDYWWWLRSGRFLEWWALWRSTPSERLRMTNLDLWLEAMDWGALERLEFVQGVSSSFVDVGAPHLTSRLKDLAIGPGRDGTRDAAARLFTTALPPEVRLERLAWTDPYWDHAVLDPILDRHGPTLRHLEVWSYEPEYSAPYDRTQAALNVSQIQRIVTSAPGLEHLALKVHRSGNEDVWPMDIFEAVAAMPRLSSADVWLDLAADCMLGAWAYTHDDPYSPRCKAGQEYRLPMLNLTSASDIFHFMKEKKVGQVELERVTFRVGDWTRPWDGPIYEPSWLEGKRVKVDCNVFREDGSRVETLEDMCRVASSEPSPDWEFGDENLLSDAELLGISVPMTEDEQEQELPIPPNQIAL